MHRQARRDCLLFNFPKQELRNRPTHLQICKYPNEFLYREKYTFLDEERAMAKSGEHGCATCRRQSFC